MVIYSLEGGSIEATTPNICKHGFENSNVQRSITLV